MRHRATVYSPTERSSPLEYPALISDVLFPVKPTNSWDIYHMAVQHDKVYVCKVAPSIVESLEDSESLTYSCKSV